MSHTTRSGTVFSPYDLIVTQMLPSPLPANIHETDVSLADDLEDAIAFEMRQAEDLDQDVDYGSEWEDLELSDDDPDGQTGFVRSNSPPLTEPRPGSPEPQPSVTPTSTPPVQPLSPSENRRQRQAEAKKLRRQKQRQSAAASATPFDYRPGSPEPQPSAASTSTPPVQPLSPSENRRQRQAEAKKLRRQKQRQSAAASATPFDYKPPKAGDQSYRTLPPEAVDFNAEDLKSSGGGSWLGACEWAKNNKRQKRKPKRWSSRPNWMRLTPAKLRLLHELLAEGNRYIQWDGKRPLYILDSDGRIVAVFVGTPDDPDWADAREEAVASGEMSAGEDRHRRGNYFSFSDGPSLGGGQRDTLSNPPKIKQIIRRLVRKLCSRRVCGFQSSSLATYAPKMYGDMVGDLRALFQHHPNLGHTSTTSIFPTVTFNCGPSTATYIHRDHKNKAGGWCGITCGGKFDTTKGGHLYLKQLKIVVEFPSGATALIPLCNRPITETLRCSPVKPDAPLIGPGWGGEELKEQLDGPPGDRARRALGLFSKLSENSYFELGYPRSSVLFVERMRVELTRVLESISAYEVDIK
ncbi:hypothetical protein C8J57DRAFT_1595769 [Mycena rebaudengoi]|nr:hypothetical protein C8J57DRAFT_1595769 [Mycena rebaudengoi]